MAQDQGSRLGGFEGFGRWVQGSGGLGFREFRV